MCRVGVVFIIIDKGCDVRKSIIRRLKGDHASRLNILIRLF